MKTQFSHLDGHGKARMVDVGSKPVTQREAIAMGEVRLPPKVLDLLRADRLPKGDVLAVARLAGMAAVKKTAELIPLCHPLMLDAVEIAFRFERDRIIIKSSVRSEGKTGVEMEALVGASLSALTIYDMCKSACKGISIGPIFLVKKSGGRSGTYERFKTIRRRTSGSTDGKGTGRSTWL